MFIRLRHPECKTEEVKRKHPKASSLQRHEKYGRLLEPKSDDAFISVGMLDSGRVSPSRLSKANSEL